MPVINKPTRITKISAELFDHILTNNFLNTDCFAGIVKIDILDHSIFWNFNLFDNKCTIFQ